MDVVDGQRNLMPVEPQSIEKSQTIVYINGANTYVQWSRMGKRSFCFLAKT